MGKNWLPGNFAETPFPFLLFRIWKTRKSGRLKIIENTTERNIDIYDGDPCVSIQSFNEELFTDSLVKTNLLEKPIQRRCLQFAQEKKIPLITALLELGIFPPDKLWKLVEVSVLKNLFPLFDIPGGEYSFDTETSLKKHEILLSIFAPDFILEGIRQMKNYKIIQKHIPSMDKKIQTFTPPYLNQIRMNHPEKYLYHSVEARPRLKELLEMSLLGKQESQKILMSLICLGLVGPSDTKKHDHSSPEFSHAEIYKMLESFNNKCSFIFKHISKEIGPAAFSVLEKCIEDIRSELSPLFRELRFDADGRIEPNSVLKTTSSLPTKDIKKTIIKDMNEILDAEILAVKRTLGNTHESTLVKNLEKIA